jgi:hypothetical protein
MCGAFIRLSFFLCVGFREDSLGQIAGQPTITGNTSRANNPMATSLKGVASGSFGQN